MWQTFDNIKHLATYNQEEENSTFHTIYGILCVMLDLHVPKIIAYLIEHVELFLYLSSFPIHPTQETSILERVFMEIFSGCLIRFLCLGVILY